MCDLAVVILTHNEERHIERAILSVSDIATDVFVIDSFSTDCTVAIAKSMGATVLQNTFVNYAKQFQWALDNAPITSAWIMRLDADEIIEPDLVKNIADTLPQLSPQIVGVNIMRKHMFMGRWIRHGGRYPLILLRIWRRGYGRIEDRWMDEHMVIWGGSTINLEGGFIDHNLNDLTFFTAKHNKYATREAVDVLNQRLGLFPRDNALSTETASWQASAKRWIKENAYNRIPFQISAVAYFFYRYAFQLGFLDGKPGLIYHFLQGFWYRFLVGAKVYELEQGIKGISDAAEIRLD